jgi:hypothetical protein
MGIDSTQDKLGQIPAREDVGSSRWDSAPPVQRRPLKLFVLTAFPEPPANKNNFQAQWLRNSAAVDPFKVHQLCDSPEDADLILFVENHPGDDPFFLTVARHPVWRRFRKKCYLYHDNDYAFPLLPGLYPSLLKPYHRPNRTAGAPYIGRIEENKALRYEPLSASPRYLYSFVGAANCEVRQRIMGLSDPRGIVQDTTGKNAWELPHEERLAYLARFAEIVKESAFVLCPRGIGPSTYRLFETLEAGRVPVILSDDWVAPEGPAWEEFSLQVPESRVADVPRLLTDYDPARIQKMATAARRAWESWFSHPVAFHRMAEWCDTIAQRRKQAGLRLDFAAAANLLHTPPRQLLRFAKRTVQARLKR